MNRRIARGALAATVLASLALAGCSHRGKAPKVAQPTACDTPTTPFCSSIVPLPDGWRGHRFTLNQRYPAEAPADEQPWLKVDPKKDPAAYTRAVLDYFYEGNLRSDVETSFEPSLNKRRGWYNAPWQTVGANGREPVHGLTRELWSPAGKLDAAQTKTWNNYAVGFYNAPAAAMIGKVWKDHGMPDPTLAIAPEGTVGAKLLFTTAPVSEVPWLAGSPEWDAYVYSDLNHDGDYRPTDPRAMTKVRLLQIDIAVKDKRAGKTGWFFGTFVYGGGPGGNTGAGWRNVQPVGLMWGNDTGYSGSGPLKETWLNPKVHMRTYGWQNRLNGPVDNPASSCMSCHMTAEAADNTDAILNNMMPPKGAPHERWFQNLPSGQPFDPGKQSTDYSLQVALGIGGFNQIHAALALPDEKARAEAVAQVHRKASKTARAMQMQ